MDAEFENAAKESISKDNLTGASERMGRLINLTNAKIANIPKDNPTIEINGTEVLNSRIAVGGVATALEQVAYSGQKVFISADASPSNPVKELYLSAAQVRQLAAVKSNLFCIQKTPR